MNFAKITLIADELENEIKSGNFGASGSYFHTARTLSSKYKVSLENACAVMSELKKRHLIRLGGNHYFTTTGYCTPDSPLFKYLGKSRKNLFGLILNNIESPFFSSLAKELGEKVERAGYRLLIYSANGDEYSEVCMVNEFIELGVSGIFTCPGMSDSLINLYRYCPLPIVCLGRTIDAGLDSVIVDNYNAGGQVASHLVDVGCRKFAYVGIDKFISKDPRILGYSEQLKKSGYKLEKNNVVAVQLTNGNADSETLAGMLGNILRARDSEKLGIFCYQDLLAAEVIKFIKLRYGNSLRIPENVSIVGFDDLPIAETLTPRLSTVSYKYGFIAEKSVEIMLNILKDLNHKPRVYEIPSSLTVRESSKVVE